MAPPASEISDSTDWLTTPLSLLTPLESSLRCQVCKDFFTTPMITSCAHTFCSLCIRRCFASDGKCPACRAGDDASRLRRNWGVEEAVEAFKTARGQALEVARKALQAEQEKATNGTTEVKGTGRRSARKRSAQVAGLEEEGTSTGRETRRKTRSQVKKQEVQDSQPDVIDLDDEEQEGTQDENIAPEEPMEEDTPQVEDGLVQCPMCGKRMKEETVFAHLDRCEEEQAQERKVARAKAASQPQISKPQVSTQNLTRLPTLNYSLLKDRPLQKKLQELGIPAWGHKQLLARRHTEWINLWNANCDSSRPRLKRELLQELDSWERSQGGHSRDTGSTPTVMRKDFDGKEWAQQNSDQFATLIAQARAKRKTPKTEDKAKDTKKEEPELKADSSMAMNAENNPAQLPTRPHASEPETAQTNGEASPSKPPILANEDSLSHIRDKVSAADRGILVQSPPPPARQDNELPNEQDMRYPDESDQPHITRDGSMPAQPAMDRPGEEAVGVGDAEKVPMFEMPKMPVKDVENSVR